MSFQKHLWELGSEIEVSPRNVVDKLYCKILVFLIYFREPGIQKGKALINSIRRNEIANVKYQLSSDEKYISPITIYHRRMIIFKYATSDDIYFGPTVNKYF